MNSKNIGNLRHILKGGVEINGNIAKINAVQLQKIIESITEDEKKVGDFIFNQLDKQYDEINKVFKREKGFVLDKEHFYFPLNVPKADISNASLQNMSIKEMSQI